MARDNTTMRIAGFIVIVVIGSGVFAMVKRGRPTVRSKPPSVGERISRPSAVRAVDGRDVDQKPSASFAVHRVVPAARGLRVLGLLENRSAVAIDAPRLTAVARDDASAEVGRATTTAPFDVPAGASVAIEVLFSGIPDGYAQLEVTTEVREHRGLPLATDLDVRVLSTTPTPRDWRVSGMIENRGARRATRVRLWAAATSGSRVVAVASRSIADLAPHEQVPFSIRIDREGAEGGLDAGAIPDTSVFATGVAAGSPGM